MNIRNFTTFMLVFLLAFAVLAQAQESTEKRLEALENKVSLLEQSAQVKAAELDGKFANKAGELDNKVEATRLQLREEFNYVRTLAIAFGSVTVLGIVIGWLSLFRRLHTIAEQKINEKFDALLQTKKEQLFALIREQDEERKLKSQKRLLVLHAANADCSFLERFFTEMEFKQVHFANIEDAAPNAQFDLVFFHNDGDDLDNRKIIEVAAKTPSHAVCFYFGPGRVETQGELERRFAFANARTQLYGNLVNALRYQKLLA